MVSEKGVRMDFEARKKQSARHEIYHAGYAHSCGFVVESVRYWPQADTVVRWPFPRRLFYTVFKSNPLLAIENLRKIVGVITAPSVCLGIEITGSDLEALKQWQRRWNCYRLLTRPEATTWEQILDDAHCRVLYWTREPGRAKFLGLLVDVLIEHGCLSGGLWTSLQYRFKPNWLR
jgi:hypothetical protein